MTAILTKQNAIDKALVGGGNNEGITNGGNGLLSNLHVYNNATFDGPSVFENFENFKVVFKSTPTFENDISVSVQRDEVFGKMDYTMKEIIENIEHNGDDIYVLKSNDKEIDATINVCIDRLVDLDNKLESHLKNNPDVSTQNITLKSSPTIYFDEPVNDPINDPVDGTVEEPVGGTQEEEECIQPSLTFNSEDVNNTLETLNNTINDTLQHFESNDQILLQKTLENKNDIDIINKIIDDINLTLDSNDESLKNINSGIDGIETNITSIENSIELINENKADNPSLLLVDDKVEKLQSSLKALIDQIHSLDKSQENHLDTNTLEVSPQDNEHITYSMRRVQRVAQTTAQDEDINENVINDIMIDWITTMNDSFNHFEENDKLLNNKFLDYYTKTECDSLMEPINEKNFIMYF